MAIDFRQYIYVNCRYLRLSVGKSQAQEIIAKERIELSDRFVPRSVVI